MERLKMYPNPIESSDNKITKVRSNILLMWFNIFTLSTAIHEDYNVVIMIPKKLLMSCTYSCLENQEKCLYYLFINDNYLF